MEKQTTSYRLETEMRDSFGKYPTRTLKCLIGAAVTIKNNATKKCSGKRFKNSLKGGNIHICAEKGNLFVIYEHSFGYEFLYDETKDSFNIKPFVSPFYKQHTPHDLAEIKTFHEEMQNEINHDAYLTRWIKAVIDCALMPNDKE